MVGGGQFVGPGCGGIDDRGQQHDQFPGAVTGPVGHVVLDDPHQVRLVGVQVGPAPGGVDDPLPTRPADTRPDHHAGVGPVGRDRHDRQAKLGRCPPQQRRPGTGRGGPAIEGVEVTVRGEQLIRAQPGVQPGGEGGLTHREGINLGGQERVRATLSQRHHPRLRKRRTVLTGPGITERRHVCVGVGHIDVEPVDGQQPPPPQPRPPRVGATNHLRHALEHIGHHHRTQPLTRLRDPTGRRHLPRRVPATEPRQRPSHLRGDLGVVVIREQAQRHRQIHHHMRRQRPTGTLRARTVYGHRRIDHIPRHRRHQHTQRHLIRRHRHTRGHRP